MTIQGVVTKVEVGRVEWTDGQNEYEMEGDTEDIDDVRIGDIIEVRAMLAECLGDVGATVCRWSIIGRKS